MWLYVRKVSHTYLSDTTHVELSILIFLLALSDREIFTIKCDFLCQITYARREVF